MLFQLRSGAVSECGTLGDDEQRHYGDSMTQQQRRSGKYRYARAFQCRQDSYKGGRWTEHYEQSTEAQHVCQGIPVACAPSSIVSSYITHARRTDLQVWAGTLDEVAGAQAKTLGSNGAHTAQFGQKLTWQKSVYRFMAMGDIRYIR